MEKVRFQEKGSFQTSIVFNTQFERQFVLLERYVVGVKILLEHVFSHHLAGVMAPASTVVYSVHVRWENQGSCFDPLPCQEQNFKVPFRVLFGSGNFEYL